MANSDDDIIEVLGEVSNNYRSSAKSKSNKSNSNGRPTTLSDDEDELLDIDDLIQLDIGFPSGSYKSKTTRSKSKTTTPNKPAVKKPKIRSGYNSANDEDVGDRASDVTELAEGREDDLDSLPSISSRASGSSSCQVLGSSGSGTSGKMGTHYDNCVFDDDEDEQKSTSTVKSRKSNETYPDRDTQDIDDFFQDAGYSSLADYLADVERERKRKTTTSASSNLLSGSSSVSSTYAPSQLSGSSSLPSTSTAIVKTKAKPKTIAHKPKEVQKSTGSLSSESITDDKTEPNVGGYQIKFTKEKKKKEPAPKKVTAPKKVETKDVPKPDPVLKPKAGEGFKMIVLQIAEEVMSDPLTAKFIEKEVQFKIIEQPQLANSIFFERNQHVKMLGYDSEIQVKVVTSIEPFLMVVFNVEKGLQLLQSEIQKSEGVSCTHQCLSDWVKGIKKKHPDKQLTLLIQGFDSYIKKIQRRVQKEYRDRVLKGDNGADAEKAKKKRNNPSKEPIQLSRNEIQSAFIRLQLQTGINYRYYENAADLCNLLFQYTKSIGDAPFKKEKNNSMDFTWYAFSDCVGGIPVDDDGKGMRSLWLSQLSQFPGVGQESAIAIARVYGSPRELYQAYRRCSCADEGISMLTNIKVTMGVGPLAKSRRLGPEASKKIYRFFTATNGDRYVTT